MEDLKIWRNMQCSSIRKLDIIKMLIFLKNVSKGTIQSQPC